MPSHFSGAPLSQLRPLRACLLRVHPSLLLPLDTPHSSRSGLRPLGGQQLGRGGRRPATSAQLVWTRPEGAEAAERRAPVTSGRRRSPKQVLLSAWRLFKRLDLFESERAGGGAEG